MIYSFGNSPLSLLFIETDYSWIYMYAYIWSLCAYPHIIHIGVTRRSNKKQKQPSDKNILTTICSCAQKPKENTLRKNRHVIAFFSKPKHFSNSYPRGDCSASSCGHFDTPPDLPAPPKRSPERFKNRQFYGPKTIRN